MDAKTGAVSGPAVDLTRELGRQLGVPVSIVGVPGAAALIDSVKNHTADIGFLAFDPSRAADVDFSQVYSLSWSSYIVPANSPLHAVADADREGNSDRRRDGRFAANSIFPEISRTPS